MAMLKQHGNMVGFDMQGDLSQSCIPSPSSSQASSPRSPAASVLSSGSSSQCGIPFKKKKGSGIQGKSIEEELCLICGDRASGYHYNALSCEGCKGFFRRSITRNATYMCKYGGKCEMDMWMRRKCQACRLRRCKEVGMKEECLLSDEQCKARDARRKSKNVGQRKGHPSPDSNTGTNVAELSNSSKDTGRSNSASGNDITQDPLSEITEKEKVLVEMLVVYQDQYEIAKEEDIKKVSQFSSNCENVTEMIFIQMAEMTILVTQLIVEFAKRLPGFMTLGKEDQIILLKGSACEVMMLRTARRYDLNTDTVVFGDGQPYTRDNLRFAGLKDFVDSMYNFCRTMGLLHVDNAEYALLTCICVFSERTGLSEPQKIEKVQEMYVRALQNYMKAKYVKKNQNFAKLLMKLTELRTLSVEHSEVLLALRVQKGSLPPLLMEYFDITE
ncbi:ecdysone receptor [Lingula anatina]|uniref:Ecdysone receptor n=1 Tax=Lingula anatina TaxID=7574 RepID=A0A1S3KGY8_LINAN|nr:ecdysone receptor [Lingula anatina]|eukprot:XP_013421724.1 ecdysone receptor [Lingula anatina]